MKTLIPDVNSHVDKMSAIVLEDDKPLKKLWQQTFTIFASILVSKSVQNEGSHLLISAFFETRNTLNFKHHPCKLLLLPCKVQHHFTFDFLSRNEYFSPLHYSLTYIRHYNNGKQTRFKSYMLCN